MWVLVVDVLEAMMTMFAFWMTNVASTYLSQRWWMGQNYGLNFHSSNEVANGGAHGCTMDLFKTHILEEEVDVFKAKLQ